MDPAPYCNNCEVSVFVDVNGMLHAELFCMIKGRFKNRFMRSQTEKI